MTDDGRARDGEAEAALSVLADALPPVPPPPPLRDRLLAALRGPARYAPFIAEIARGFDLTADAVRDAFARMNEPDAWQPALVPGSSFLTTDALRAARTVISRLPAGTRIPNHGHAGRELTYVLDGELIENGSAQIGPGQLLDMNLGDEHALAVADDAECLVVFSLRLR